MRVMNVVGPPLVTLIHLRLLLSLSVGFSLFALCICVCLFLCVCLPHLLILKYSALFLPPSLFYLLSDPSASVFICL